MRTKATMKRKLSTTVASMAMAIGLLSQSVPVYANQGKTISTAFVSAPRTRPAFASSQATFPTSSQYVQQQGFRQSLQLYMERPSNGTMGVNLGKNQPNKKSSTELSASFSDVVSAADFNYKIYCDMDGVLVDFERGVLNLLNAPSSKLVKGTMWKNIARTNAFFENLPWTQDGKQLWNAIRDLRPDILTGVPYPKQSRTDKVKWCKRELGLEALHHVDMAAGCKDHESVNGNHPIEEATNVITCWSNNKHMELYRGGNHKAVLIDDRECAREPWEQAGGIFIHHVDAATTIQKLWEYGILPNDKVNQEVLKMDLDEAR